MTKTKKEETFEVNGENLLKKIKEIINEGNVRKITIKDKKGKNIIMFPLTVGVVGTVIAPVLAAVGALAALIGECTITVEKAVERNVVKLNEKTGLYENYGLWHVPFWQTQKFKMVAQICLFLIIVCIVILLIKKYLAYRKRKKVPLWDQALFELTRLKKEHKIDVVHGKEFYATISAVLKKYFHDRFGYELMGKTDDEAVAYLKNNHKDEHMLEEIKAVLQGGVIIKFANAQAAQEQMEQDYVRIVGIIKRTIPEK